MKAPLLALFLLCTAAVNGTEVTISPSDVYAQARQIEKEVDVLKAHLGITGEKPAPPVKADLKARHVWQTSYFILVKINIFRRRNGLPVVTANSLEPVADLDPALVYEQTQRILAEIRILKTRLGIGGEVTPAQAESGRRPIDVFNRFNSIAAQWDVLNGEEISPPYVFAEVMRIYHDVDTVLHALQLEDHSFPPAKQPQAQSADSMEVAHALLQEIQRLQRGAGIPRTDLAVFHKQARVLPSDVLNMVGMALAELQTVKAHLDLGGDLTPPAGTYRDKSPADVHQLLGWVVRKLQLIRSL